MSHSRQIILDRIRSRSLPPTAAPLIDVARMIQYDNLIDQFCSAAEFVGAMIHRVSTEAEVADRLAEMDGFSDAPCVASTVASVPGNFDPAEVSKPQELAPLDWMIMRGRFGVAENGAIWMPAEDVHDRVQIFITQHLVILLDVNEMVPHMHAAYDRLGRFEGYGVFVSGPSKTADIEQSLVLGAHGCRTLQIFLIGNTANSQSESE